MAPEKKIHLNDERQTKNTAVPLVYIFSVTNTDASNGHVASDSFGTAGDAGGVPSALRHTSPPPPPHPTYKIWHWKLSYLILK